MRYFWAFAIGMACYGLLLLTIYFLNYSMNGFVQRSKSAALVFVNLVLISFICVFQYYFQAYRFTGSNYLLPYSLLTFGMYLIGLGVFHSTAVATRRIYHDTEVISSYHHASMQMRMIIPFALPFLTITAFFDLLHWIPNEHFQQWMHEGFTVWYAFGSMLFLALLTMIFMPAVIQNIWQCKPFPESDLKVRLEQLCQRAHFRHGGMLTWTIMNDALTAAIVGVVPRYRYVMFTNRLIRSVSANSIEAILAHEIGHSYRRHLWIYPLIIFGMFLTTALYSHFIGDYISQYFTVQSHLYPSWKWEVFDALTTFASYAVIILLYFRIVFGYFSRLFERQADLHVFHLGVNPEWMIEALDDIAVQSGNIHLLPSWHHYSIQQRIDIIRKAQANPKIVEEHNRWVRINVRAYAAVAACVLWYLVS